MLEVGVRDVGRISFMTCLSLLALRLPGNGRTEGNILRNGG